MDSKPVHILSTFLPQQAPVIRNSKDNSGVYVQLNIPRPTTIAAYNTAMGGTDLFDQLGSYYRTTHKSIKWHHRIINHFIQVSALNAYILSRETLQTENDSFGFMIDLVEQWGGANNANDDSDSNSDQESSDGEMYARLTDEAGVRRKRKALYSDFKGRTTGKHWPAAALEFCRTVNERTGKYVEMRHDCCVCGCKTRFQCATCNVFVCIGPVNRIGCFEKLHTQQCFADTTSSK